jgi:hypothetical protein
MNQEPARIMESAFPLEGSRHLVPSIMRSSNDTNSIVFAHGRDDVDTYVPNTPLNKIAAGMVRPCRIESTGLLPGWVLNVSRRHQAEFQKRLGPHKWLLIAPAVSAVLLFTSLGYPLPSIEHRLGALSTLKAADNRARQQSPRSEISGSPMITQNSQEPADLPANAKLPVAKEPRDTHLIGKKVRSGHRSRMSRKALSTNRAGIASKKASARRRSAKAQPITPNSAPRPCPKSSRRKHE